MQPKENRDAGSRNIRPITNSYQLSNITDDQIKYFLTQKMINPAIEQALRKVITQKNSIAALDADVSSRKTKIREFPKTNSASAKT